METSTGLYLELEIPSKNLKDFLITTDVMGVKIVETAGTSLPYMFMIFRTYNSTVRDCIIQNNELKVKIGETESNADTFTVYPEYVDPDKDKSDTGWLVKFSGYLLPKNYMVGMKSKVYPGNSLHVAKQIIKDAFGKDIKTSITKVDENQVNWRRVNQTDRYFLLNVLEHMDLGDSFPLFTFDKFGNFILKSFDDIVKEGPKYTLVPYPPYKANQYMYMNNFQIENWKNNYNLYAGYNRYTEVEDAETGKIKSVFIENTPMLAATKEVEKSNVEATITMNNVQSGNVHKTYNQTFIYNTNKQVLLSSVCGTATLRGRYYRNLAPLDLVSLVTSTGKDDDADSGLYLIDTISTYFDFITGVIDTDLYLTRDNRNFIEDFTNPIKGINITRQLMEQLCSAIHDLKRAYSFAMDVMDGEYLSKILNFGIETKNNMLRCFSLFGQTIDFTSGANLLSSLTLVGNSLMNSLCDMIFPDYIADTLRDFIITKPTAVGLISTYVDLYVPVELQGVIMSIATALFDTTDTLNSIAEDNGINVISGEIRPVEDTTNAIEEEISDNQAKVSQIISDFEDNTTGLDIPFPIIGLDEAEELLPEEQLREHVADVTIDNLSELGYLDDEDADQLKKILLGEEQIDFNLIQRINKKAGDTMNYRYWGTFGYTGEALYAWTYGENSIYTKTSDITEKTRLYNSDYSPYVNAEFKVEITDDETYIITYNGEKADRNEELDISTNPLAELTSYNIKMSYKDKYRTIPCTKFINAMQNSRIYFVCPSSETDLRFYINAKRVELKSFEIDLGIVDIYNKSILYMVYYTTTGYNSSSVLFEVRKGN